MPIWLYPLLYLLLESYSSRRDAQVRFLKVQNQMLRARLSGNRIILTPEERFRLLRLGERLGHRVEHVICIVTFPKHIRTTPGERAKVAAYYFSYILKYRKSVNFNGLCPFDVSTNGLINRPK